MFDGSGNVNSPLISLLICFSSLVYNDNLETIVSSILSVKSTEIGLTVPKLFGLDPEKVSVTASSTKATNGDNGIAFSFSAFISFAELFTNVPVNLISASLEKLLKSNFSSFIISICNSISLASPLFIWFSVTVLFLVSMLCTPFGRTCPSTSLKFAFSIEI